MNDELRSVGGRPLPAGHTSLARGVPVAMPGTIHALTIGGGITVRPKDGRTIVFGRNRPEVHVCIGENDRRVSRRHGSLSFRLGHWWVDNAGRLPIRLPGSRLLFDADEPIPLTEGYTPLFIRGSNEREHLLEVHVVGAADVAPVHHGDPTQPPRTWRLTDTEKLLLVVLAQRYLLHDSHPQPLSWRQAEEHLAEIQPAVGWRAKQIERRVTAVRERLSANGVPGLTRDEVGEPVGNMLNHNLIRELLTSTTLVVPDLYLLDSNGL